jgi:hypothetical protein
MGSDNVNIEGGQGKFGDDVNMKNKEIWAEWKCGLKK